MPIHHVTEAIRQLLDTALREPEIWADQSVDTIPAEDVYVGPPDPEKAIDRLVLFLMRITPTPELRNAERLRKDPTKPTEPPKPYEPALPLDLHYLVTCGPPQSRDEGIRNDFALTRLARAIRGIEAASPLTLPLYHQDAIWLSIDPMSTDELSRIWALFPTMNCRTSFMFRASPVWVDPTRPRLPGGPVIDRDLRGGTLREALQ